MATALMKGSRLEFVTVPLEGTVRRPVHRLTSEKLPSGKIVHKRTESLEDEPGGWLLYCPRGHVVRIRTEEELRHYQVDREPKIINLEGLNDPNSPLGKLLRAQDEGSREEAFKSMEEQVIRLATAMSGPLIMPEQARNRASIRPPNNQPRAAGKAA